MVSNVVEEVVSARQTARDLLRAPLRDLIRALGRAAETIEVRRGGSRGNAKSADRVHQLRVATRRVTVAGEAAGPILTERGAARLHRLVRGLRRAAGAVRDCDVHLALLEGLGGGGDEGVRNVIEELKGRIRRERRERAGELRKVIAAADAGRVRRLGRKLWRTAEARGPAGNASELVDSAIAAGVAGVEAARSGNLAIPESLHTLRLAVKRLRYIFGLAPSEPDPRRAASVRRTAQRHAARRDPGAR